MRAVQGLHQVAPQLPEPRGLWWTALGLLELLRDPPQGDWLACARPLLNKIDFHLRDLAAGAGASGEALLREVLYVIGRSRAGTPHARDVRTLYQLDSLFPAPPSEDPVPGMELNSEWLEAALYDLHSRLEALKTAWVHYISGEQKSPARFRDLLASFKAKAARARKPAPHQAARRGRARHEAPARPVPEAEAVHGDRDGLGVPADRDRHRPLQQPAARPGRADRDPRRLGARRGERQVERRAARAPARRPAAQGGRASAAHPGGARNLHQPAAYRAGARLVRARSRRSARASRRSAPTCTRCTAR